MPIHKFNILNRFSGDIQFTAEIDCSETASLSTKTGLAAKWAYLRDANLRGANLRGANLRDANLRDADLRGADLRGADLSGADLSGADLSSANLRDADLSGADLRGADLSGANLSGADLSSADLRDANLRDADLRGADLRDANLSGADLRGADLRGADLRDANNIPAIPSLDTKILAAIDAGGKLDMSSWHTCRTTHCRAGWAITLAGEAGHKLELQHGADVAGALIYAKSYPDQPIPNFYTNNDEALNDIKARAASDPKETA